MRTFKLCQKAYFLCQWVSTAFEKYLLKSFSVVIFIKTFSLTLVGFFLSFVYSLNKIDLNKNSFILASLKF